MGKSCVNCSAMPYEVEMRRDELLKWGVDLIEVNIGDEAVDGSVNAAWLRPMQIAVRRVQIQPIQAEEMEKNG